MTDCTTPVPSMSPENVLAMRVRLSCTPSGARAWSSNGWGSHPSTVNDDVAFIALTGSARGSCW